jgi:2-keto-4-pentenoate hydratase/2-oxohepta-3-ene-1,7-dioic acid hydratase in catechol pathway
MKIIRFIDEGGKVCTGKGGSDGEAAVLDPASLKETGLNYRLHAQESGLPLPQHPVLFMKNPAALTNPEDPIVIPSNCVEPQQVDYECELAVVIGRRAKDVKESEALSYVRGYTIANDVSARHWQKEAGGGQWVRGKSFDTFCPLGPVLVTSDEIPDPQTLRLTTRLNGQTMQDANTSDMIFPVAELIARLSCGMTLLPGTVILTGTPSGVGVARNPKVFIRPGDRIELTIDRIGTLSNPVVAAV